MAPRNQGGRPSLYPGKAGGMRVQGCLTRRGGLAFDTWRAWLAVTKARTSVSDADVIEYLARREKPIRKRA